MIGCVNSRVSARSNPRCSSSWCRQMHGWRRWASCRRCSQRRTRSWSHREPPTGRWRCSSGGHRSHPAEIQRQTYRPLFPNKVCTEWSKFVKKFELVRLCVVGKWHMTLLMQQAIPRVFQNIFLDGNGCPLSSVGEAQIHGVMEKAGLGFDKCPFDISCQFALLSSLLGDTDLQFDSIYGESVWALQSFGKLFQPTCSCGL